MVTSNLQKNLPWLRRLVSGLSLPSREFVHCEIRGGENCHWVSFPPEYLSFPPVNINPSMLHTRHHLQVALTPSRNGRIIGIFPKIKALSQIGEHWIEKYPPPPRPTFVYP